MILDVDKMYTPDEMSKEIPWEEMQSGIFIGTDFNGETRTWSTDMTNKDQVWLVHCLNTFIRAGNGDF